MAVNAALARSVRSHGPSERGAALRALGAAVGAYAAVAALGLAAAEALRPAARETDSHVFLVVQPALHPRERWSPHVQQTNLAHLADTTAHAMDEASARPDLVLWPENTLTRALDADSELRAALEARVTTLGVPVVLGAVRSGSRDWRYRSAVLRVDPVSGIADAVDKTRAIPFVEGEPALPGAAQWSRALFGLGTDRALVEPALEGRALGGRPELAAVLCYEALFPDVVGSRRSRETAALVVLGTDTWFPGAAASRQQIAFASFRAIEQRSWLLRAAEGGGSAVIDPFGRVTQQLPFGRAGHLRAEITPQMPPTPAERTGLAALLAAGAAAGVAATNLVRRRRVP
jgi:apolipoprotein N-acyltransferase